MGLCYAGNGKFPQAVDHWKKFITAAPAGAYRAQASIESADLYLQELLDLDNAAANIALAKNNLPEGAKDIKSGPSWKDAAFDIELRNGMIQYIKGDFPAALQAFTDARKAIGGTGVSPVSGSPNAASAPSSQPTAANKALADGIDQLIAAAKESRPVTPDEIRDPKANKQTAMAFAISNIFCLTGRLDEAERLVDRILTGKNPPPIQAYAEFCKTRITQSRQGQSGYEKLKSGYQECLKTYPQGTWHDETLCRLAALIENEAQTKFGPNSTAAKAVAQPPSAVSPSSRPGVASAAPPRLPTAEELKKQEEARKARQSDFLKLRSESLPYWQEIVKRYSTTDSDGKFQPKSPFVEPAMYMAGVLFIDMDRWKEGLSLLDRLAEAYPNGPCTGETLLVLGQYSLERRVDGGSSKANFSRLDVWIDAVRKQSELPVLWQRIFPVHPVVRSQATATSDTKSETVKISVSSVIARHRYTAEELLCSYRTKPYLDALEAECAKWLCFINFANGQKDKALSELERARGHETKDANIHEIGDFNDFTRLKWGIDHGYLYCYPKELEQYEGNQRLAVLLADFYYVTQRFDEAATVSQRLLKGDFGALAGTSAEYPQHLYATCLYWTGGRAAAVEEYLKVVGDFTKFDPNNSSLTRERAAYAAGNIAMDMPDGPQRQKGKELLRRLAFSGRTSQYAYQARIAYAGALINEGRNEEGYHLLETFPETAGKWKAIATSYAESYREAEKNRNGK